MTLMKQPVEALIAQNLTIEEIKEKLTSEIYSDLFDRDTINAYFKQHQEKLEEAEVLLLQKLVLEHVKDKNLTKIEHILHERKFDEELIKSLHDKDNQMHVAKIYIKENKALKKTIEIEQELNAKGFEKSIIERAFNEIKKEEKKPENLPQKIHKSIPREDSEGENQNNNLWGMICNIFDRHRAIITFGVLAAITSTATFTLYKFLKR